MVIVIGFEDWFPGLPVSSFELLQSFSTLRASTVSTFGNNRCTGNASGSSLQCDGLQWCCHNVNTAVFRVCHNDEIHIATWNFYAAVGSASQNPRVTTILSERSVFAVPPIGRASGA